MLLLQTLLLQTLLLRFNKQTFYYIHTVIKCIQHIRMYSFMLGCTIVYFKLFTSCWALKVIRALMYCRDFQIQYTVSMLCVIIATIFMVVNWRMSSSWNTIPIVHFKVIFTLVRKQKSIIQELYQVRKSWSLFSSLHPTFLHSQVTVSNKHRTADVDYLKAVSV